MSIWLFWLYFVGSSAMKHDMNSKPMTGVFQPFQTGSRLVLAPMVDIPCSEDNCGKVPEDVLHQKRYK